MASHAFAVEHIANAKAEIFAPGLQVVRWGTGDTSNPEDVIAQINVLGYDLTLGIQTRIDSRTQALACTDATDEGRDRLSPNGGLVQRTSDRRRCDTQSANASAVMGRANQ